MVYVLRFFKIWMITTKLRRILIKLSKIFHPLSSQVKKQKYIPQICIINSLFNSIKFHAVVTGMLNSKICNICLIRWSDLYLILHQTSQLNSK